MKREVKFISLEKYGRYLAGILILCSVLKHGIWSNPNNTFLFLCNLLIAFPAYVYFISKGIKFSKEKIYREHFKKAQGIKSGMFIGLVAAVLFSIYVFCETQIFPDYYSMQIEQQVEMLAQEGLCQEAMKTKHDNIIMMNQPYIHVLSTFVTVIMASIIISLFATSFIYKKTIVKSEEEK